MDDYYGIYNPDVKATYDQYIEIEAREQHVWNEEEKEWETDSEYDSDDDDDVEFDELQERAEKSIQLHKRPFDKKERQIRKANPDWPLWMARWWFYLSTFDEEREAQVLKLEDNLKKQAYTKKRKQDRDKLFKRLGMRRKR